MELKEGTDVFTADGEQVGKINRVVLDPATNEVTHIVVQKGWLLPADKVVPIAMISSATEDRVVLNKDIVNFDQLPPFEETHFVELTQADLPSMDYNTDMLPMLNGFPFSDEWMSPTSVRALFGAARMNQYITNWPIVLKALRQLWETGKVSELKTPFYELLEKPKTV